MKKIKLMSVIAVAGFLGLTARAASVSGADAVTIKATIMLQTNETPTSEGEKFNVTTVKVTTKDILTLVSNEFDVAFPVGAQLGVDSFFHGQMEVLDKSGGVILADATTNADGYDLVINVASEVLTGSETDAAETDDYTTISTLTYDSADGESFFDIAGSASVKDSFNDTKETDSESFDLSGAGSAAVNNHEGLIKGTVSGKGINGDFGD
jgi:hypothetical protein